MNLTIRARRLVAGLAGAAILATAVPALAQEIAPSHLAAARSAIGSVRVTDQFDSILPAAAQALKSEMIQKDPNLEDLIVKTVDEKTLELAKRRADLENEAASVYARAFSEQELKEIAAFYGSPTGAKLLEQGGQVTGEVMQAAEIWQRGVARDLAQNVANTFEAAAPRSPATQAAGDAATTAPAAPAAPAQ
jgi:uncharacterized protein